MLSSKIYRITSPKKKGTSREIVGTERETGNSCLINRRVIAWSGLGILVVAGVVYAVVLEGLPSEETMPEGRSIQGRAYKSEGPEKFLSSSELTARGRLIFKFSDMRVNENNFLVSPKDRSKLRITLRMDLRPVMKDTKLNRQTGVIGTGLKFSDEEVDSIVFADDKPEKTILVILHEALFKNDSDSSLFSVQLHMNWPETEDVPAGSFSTRVESIESIMKTRKPERLDFLDSSRGNEDIISLKLQISKQSQS